MVKKNTGVSTNKMRILLTGDKGFIESHLQVKLRNLGFIVNGYDLKVGYDIRNRRQVDQAFSLFKPRVVIHLAALTGVRLSEQIPAEYFKTNVMGMYNVLEEAKKRGVDNFLFASSSSVYGNEAKCPLRENMEKNPISIYGLTKHIGEMMCKQFSKYFPVVVFRPFTVYGEQGRKGMVIRRLITAGRKNKTFYRFGDGNSKRGYTNVHDLNDGIVKLIDYRPTNNFEDFNLGGSEIIKLNDLIDLMGEQFPNLKVEEINRNSADVLESYADTYKVYKEIGWEPKRDFKKEIKKLCRI